MRHYTRVPHTRIHFHEYFIDRFILFVLQGIFTWCETKNIWHICFHLLYSRCFWYDFYNLCDALPLHSGHNNKMKKKKLTNTNFIAYWCGWRRRKKVKWKNATKTISERFSCQNREMESILNRNWRKKRGVKWNFAIYLLPKICSFECSDFFSCLFLSLFLSPFPFASSLSEVSFQLKLYYVTEIHIWRVWILWLDQMCTAHKMQSHPKEGQLNYIYIYIIRWHWMGYKMRNEKYGML